jgi:hypothetical protein
VVYLKGEFMHCRVIPAAVVILLLAGFSVGYCAGEEVLPGPKYSNLRYDEDFSYLAGEPGSYVEDRWDRIKWMEVSDGWFLTLGGQARLRLERENNKSFGTVSPGRDTYGLQRYFLHGDLRNKDGLRFFVQGKFAHANSRDRGGMAGLEDHADFHQAFADVPTSISDFPMTFRLGRQELQYGAQRLVSPLDWGNLRRAFEGVKVMTDMGPWKVDAFAVRPIKNDRRNLDDGDSDIGFLGLYGTRKINERWSKDLYFLVLDNDHDRSNANGSVGSRTLYTPGIRLWGKDGSWDYEAEAAAQFGTFAGDRVKAGMVTVGGGYTVEDCPYKTRLGLMYDYASGDSSPTDSTHGTFNHLFPLGHAWLGYLDVVGRSNIHAIKAQVKVHPSKKVTAWVDFHTFYADQDQDALYSAGGVPIRPNPTGASSQFIGHEIDIAMKVVLDVHTEALVGYSHMWPGGFVQSTGSADEPDFFYGQVEYKF